MNSQKEVLPLRVVAVRFINDDELEGLARLDAITAGVHGAIGKKLLAWEIAFWALSLATFITLLPGLGMLAFDAEGGELLVLVGFVPFALWVSTIVYWRYLQYGALRANEPQTPLYADPDDPDVRNLERLFAVLQLESTPRTFYVMRNGSRREIDERYFFGSLRAAFVSRDTRVRSILFSPSGWWFSREIFMEVDVAELIDKAGAKPKRGPNKTYDYTDAVMSLIEHPDIRAMKVPKRGNQTKIKDLLESWYRSRRQKSPANPS